jgi:hypothetical protein
MDVMGRPINADNPGIRLGGSKIAQKARRTTATSDPKPTAMAVQRVYSV